jgi:diphthamide biosynthesis protein 4
VRPSTIVNSQQHNRTTDTIATIRVEIHIRLPHSPKTIIVLFLLLSTTHPYKPESMNHYATLNLSFPAPHTPADIKRAYQAALLANHPDKSEVRPLFTFVPSTVDQIRAAYAVLSDPALRAAHDLELALSSLPKAGGPTRDDIAAAEEVDLDALPFDCGRRCWLRRCRCGAVARLDELDLDAADSNGEAAVLVPCEGCSLWARVVFAVDDGVDWEGVAVDDADVELDESMVDDADDEADEDEDDDDDSDDEEDDDGDCKGYTTLI